MRRNGRHLLTYGDGGADHCRRCGTFREFLTYLQDGKREATDCHPVPHARRWWPQGQGAKAKEARTP